MIRLQTKLTLFNLISKLVFSALFIGFLPLVTERIITMQTDRELIDKREEVISLISKAGIEPFITPETSTGFGSYNILKEEFISLERIDLPEDWNFIEVTQRIIDDETIDYRVLNYSLKINGQNYLLEIGKSLTSIMNAERNIRSVILILLAVFILVTLLADLLFTARVLRPLRIITKRIESTSSPYLSVSEPLSTTTEDFIELDRTLREMMQKIEDLFRKEKEITVNISHELMTPVSVLRGRLENMLVMKNLDPEIENGIDESLKTLHRLKVLVNSLLMISRIERKQYLKEDSIKIHELLGEVKDELLPIASDAGVSVSLHCPEDFIFRNANRSLLFSMFYNVVNNAVKNTPAGGKIDIDASVTNEKLEVSVIDTGKGMTTVQLEDLFSRFKTEISHDENSSGIGLAITKSIADFHNIEIQVSSEPGKGTRFLFFFP
jgi:signal transduction histidine kinase